LDEALAKLLKTVVGAELFLAVSQAILAAWLSWVEERWFLTLARWIVGDVVKRVVLIRPLVTGNARIVKNLLSYTGEARFGLNLVWVILWVWYAPVWYIGRKLTWMAIGSFSQSELRLIKTVWQNLYNFWSKWLDDIAIDNFLCNAVFIVWEISIVVVFLDIFDIDCSTCFIFHIFMHSL